MLNERVLQLLTAFVDGELTRRQRKVVLRLLHRSSVARGILRDLQENAHKIQQLPRHRLPGDFTSAVLRAIDQPVSRPVPGAARARRRIGRWPASAAAAAILLALFGGYLFFQPAPERPNGAGPVVHAPSVNPWVGKIIDGAVESFVKPLPPGVQIAFHDLEQAPQRQRLTQELKKATAYHLDVNVRSSRQAVERINEVFKSQDISLLLDDVVKTQLKKDEPRTDFVLYAENLQPEELTAILQQLNAGAKLPKSEPPAFESLWLTAFTADDQAQLAGLMGTKAEVFTPPSPGGADNLFKDLPIQKTADPSKKTNGKSQGNPPRPHRYAVVLASQSGPVGAVSQEVKTFLATRRQQRPGTVQVVVVLHAV